jgi:hypothetical protein
MRVGDTSYETSKYLQKIHKKTNQSKKKKKTKNQLQQQKTKHKKKQQHKN